MSVETAEQWDTTKVITAPNVLSFLRLLSVPAFFVLLLLKLDVAALIVLMAFGSTDWMDGYLARRLKQRSALGAKLDPAADRLFIIMVVVGYMIRGFLSWKLALLVMVRDVGLALLVPPLKKLGRLTLPVNKVGKLATLLLMCSFPFMLLGYSPDFLWKWAEVTGVALFVIGLIGYWVAGVMYLRQYWALKRSLEAERGAK